MSVPIADHGNGKSLCYGCRYWDFDIVRDFDTLAARWDHVCNSPIEGLKPGDCVIRCEGYQAEKRDWHP